MHTVKLKLVTIITERIIEDRLLREIEQLGAKGYTLSQATGRGSRGVRASEWEGPDTRIETVVSPETADRIAEHVATRYFEHYAVVLFIQDAEVVRGEKYT